VAHLPIAYQRGATQPYSFDPAEGAGTAVATLTGALMDADGRAVRIGAEGMLARRTDIVMSGFGAQRLITDEDVSQLRTLRRDDLPGRPLVWQVALRTLLGQLTGVAVAPSGSDGARDPQQDQ
jgi:hypothetical protein